MRLQKALLWICLISACQESPVSPLDSAAPSTSPSAPPAATSASPQPTRTPQASASATMRSSPQLTASMATPSAPQATASPSTEPLSFTESDGCTPPPETGNLVRNADFEQPVVTKIGYQIIADSFDSWKVDSGTVELAGSIWSAGSGSQSLDLDGKSYGSLS